MMISEASFTGSPTTSPNVFFGSSPAAVTMLVELMVGG
jgi:hypothetical protein